MAKKVAAKKTTPAAKKTAAKKAPSKTAAKKAPAKKTAPKPQTASVQSEGTVMPEDTARGSIVKLRVPYNANTLSAVATRLGKKKMLRRELQDHLMEVVKTYLSESGAPALGAPTPVQGSLPFDTTSTPAQGSLPFDTTSTPAPVVVDADDLLG